MKLKPKKKLVTLPKEEPKKANKKVNKLPSDEYKPIFEPIRILVRETFSNNDGSLVKQYLEMSVKRFNDDIGLPYVWITMYQESAFYTGYLKGKTIYFPLEQFYDVMDRLNELSDECDSLGIE